MTRTSGGTGTYDEPTASISSSITFCSFNREALVRFAEDLLKTFPHHLQSITITGPEKFAVFYARIVTIGSLDVTAILNFWRRRLSTFGDHSQVGLYHLGSLVNVNESR